MVSNEVFVGAGTMATLVPEMDMYFDDCVVTFGSAEVPNLNIVVLETTDQEKFKLITNLYQGCRVKVVSGTGGAVFYASVNSNDSKSFTLDSDVSVITTGTEVVHVTLLSFGAPVIAPTSYTNSALGSPKLLSDNWLGLVNSFSPPSVDAQLVSLNLVGGNTRNIGLQYKGAETVSGGSLDISMNNGSWLFYALGKVSALTNSGSDSSEAWDASTENKFIYNSGGVGISRVITGGIEYPPLSTTTDTVEGTLSNLPAYDEIASADFLTYTFDETNGASLPSFGLDVSYRKAGVSASTPVDNLTPHENIYSRIFTGCQVNTLTLNFESESELKTSLDLVCRRVFDAPSNSVVQNTVATAYTANATSLVLADASGFGSTGRGTINGVEFTWSAKSTNTLTITALTSSFPVGAIVMLEADDYVPHNGKLNTSDLQNFSATASDNYPFMFSDGALKVFSETYARVKSGSITINNNITPARYIGNTSRQVMNEHIPAQRTYEISMTALITDTTLWDELRKDNESVGFIELNFTKESGEFIKLKLTDFIINTVDIPFPEDKGAIEVSFTASARTLNNAQYKGKWALMH
jgi:3D (Asp-Asp-Asp) domain-containing protein